MLGKTEACVKPEEENSIFHADADTQEVLYRWASSGAGQPLPIKLKLNGSADTHVLLTAAPLGNNIYMLFENDGDHYSGQLYGGAPRYFGMYDANTADLYDSYVHFAGNSGSYSDTALSEELTSGVKERLLSKFMDTLPADSDEPWYSGTFYIDSTSALKELFPKDDHCTASAVLSDRMYFSNYSWDLFRKNFRADMEHFINKIVTIPVRPYAGMALADIRGASVKAAEDWLLVHETYTEVCRRYIQSAYAFMLSSGKDLLRSIGEFIIKKVKKFSLFDCALTVILPGNNSWKGSYKLARTANDAIQNLAFSKHLCGYTLESRYSITISSKVFISCLQGAQDGAHAFELCGMFVTAADILQVYSPDTGTVLYPSPDFTL